MQGQQDESLISSEWEEAIIKEQRKPDIPFDLMQKDTIDQLHNNLNREKKGNTQHPMVWSNLQVNSMPCILSSASVTSKWFQLLCES